MSNKKCFNCGESEETKYIDSQKEFYCEVCRQSEIDYIKDSKGGID